MKKIVIFGLLTIIMAGVALAARPIDYRGIFPADRESDARITNYILLRKDTRIRFEIEEQGKGATGRIKVEKVQLTSAPDVSFSDVSGITLLNVPESGIYEVTLVPSAEPGEIRFVLRVVETSEDGQPQSAVASPTASATAPVQAAADIGRAVIIDASLSSQPEVLPAATMAGVLVASDPIPLPATGSLSVDKPEIQATQVIASSSDSSLSFAALKAPAEGFFINPFSGFKFVGEGLNLISESERRKQIKVSNRMSDGSLTEVAGSFFSPEPDILMFLPQKVLPGAIYYIEIYDAAGSRRAEYQAAALPELAVEFKRVSADVLVTVSWQPQETLLSNPAGQMLSLRNCDLSVFSGENLLVNLSGEQMAQPFGSLSQINWRARPYALELEMPAELIASDCRLEVLAAVDGSEARNVAYRSTWQKTGEDNDFSDVEASDDLIYEKPKEQFSIQPFSAREQLPDATVFAIEKSFSLVDNEADSLVAWPQDIAWDENGSLWVLDSQLRRIANYNAGGILRISFGTRGDTPGSLGVPVALAQKNASLFVSDTSRHAVHKFTTEGLFVVSILSEPSSGVTIDLPGGICFRKDEMWVADRGSARILCFNQQGGFLGSFGSTAAAPIEAPVSVRADADSLFILERSGLVKKFSPMGQFDATFQSGSSDGSGLEVDPWGGVWVCDAGKFKVVRFSRKGAVLTELAAPPAPKPWLPTAAAVRSDGKVAVTDAANKMLHIFTPVEP
jgi:sugar lactone lactonase YvrE